MHGRARQWLDCCCGCGGGGCRRTYRAQWHGPGGTQRAGAPRSGVPIEARQVQMQALCASHSSAWPTACVRRPALGHGVGDDEILQASAIGLRADRGGDVCGPGRGTCPGGMIPLRCRHCRGCGHAGSRRRRPRGRWLGLIPASFGDKQQRQPGPNFVGELLALPRQIGARKCRWWREGWLHFSRSRFFILRERSFGPPMLRATSSAPEHGGLLLV